MSHIHGVTGWRYAHKFMSSYSKYHPTCVNRRLVLCDCFKVFQLEYRLGINHNTIKYGIKDKRFIFDKNKILRRSNNV